MDNSNYNTSRIAKNSVLLYVRMLFTMWLNLYATRLTLVNLGVDDMGVFGVVGGIVNLIAVFTGGITNAVQRFLTYELGKQNGDTNKVFCSSLNVIFILSFFVILLLETIGVWMLNNKVEIPFASQDAAFWVFQFSIITCIFNLIGIPYNALVIAHEKMDVFAVISISQVILNFCAAYFISFFDQRLLWYGILIAFASVVTQVFYYFYCNFKFSEAHFHFFIDKSLFKQIGKFTGISTLSGALQTLSGQGIILVINWTFGIGLNTVYTIALQLKNSVQSFAFNIFKAISPQITKTYASGDFENHKKLVYAGAKIESFMIFLIMIPFLFRTRYIMELWLGDVPPFTVEFVQCIIFLSLTYAIFEPIRTSVLATNNIMKFMLIPELLYLFVLPVGFVVSKVSCSPFFLILAIVSLDVLTCIVRTVFAVKVCPISIRGILKYTIIPAFIVAIVDSFVCYSLTFITEETFCGLILLLVLNSISLCVVIYLMGSNNSEKKACAEFVRSMTSRFGINKCCREEN